MLSLSRVLGGSLRGQQTAHLIKDAELDKLVRELLSSVREPLPYAEKRPAASVLMHSGRHHLRTVGISEGARFRTQVPDPEPELILGARI